MFSTDIAFVGLYYFFAVVAVGSAGVVAFSRNLANAIFMLLFALGSVAAFYGFLGADFLLAAQVLIYVGGILVILIFAMMISERFPLQQHELTADKAVSGGLMSLLFLGVMFMVAWGTEWPSGSLSEFEFSATTAEIGSKLLTSYFFPFEIAALILLVALIGATMMTRKDDTEPHPNIEYERERDNE